MFTFSPLYIYIFVFNLCSTKRIKYIKIYQTLVSLSRVFHKFIIFPVRGMQTVLR